MRLKLNLDKTEFLRDGGFCSLARDYGLGPDEFFEWLRGWALKTAGSLDADDVWQLGCITLYENRVHITEWKNKEECFRLSLFRAAHVFWKSAVKSVEYNEELAETKSFQEIPRFEFLDALSKTARQVADYVLDGLTRKDVLRRKVLSAAEWKTGVKEIRFCLGVA